ncbi:hypothetical protein SAY86_007012 [Trapa natans]|uniref:AN1-type domain-containing protein n=1 Tax=Trapa natans TaxID=22666 RepID=A0AAN7L7G9_TRANT|nr:hypothetical protein SAY86_007012 [Trapa natans]
MRGTEAFPDLGRHCQHPDCHQLDFLPFTCHGCDKMFCLEHRSYKDHGCPGSDRMSRKVIVCETCSTSIETTGKDVEEERLMMEDHWKSGSCNPARKKKPKCPVKRCRETLTFSNTITCKICKVNVCLSHRAPADHECLQKQKTWTISPAPSCTAGASKEKFMEALSQRDGKDFSKGVQASGDQRLHKAISVH